MIASLFASIQNTRSQSLCHIFFHPPPPPKVSVPQNANWASGASGVPA